MLLTYPTRPLEPALRRIERQPAPNGKVLDHLARLKGLVAVNAGLVHGFDAGPYIRNAIVANRIGVISTEFRSIIRNTLNRVRSQLSP